MFGLYNNSTTGITNYYVWMGIVFLGIDANLPLYPLLWQTKVNILEREKHTTTICANN